MINDTIIQSKHIIYQTSLQTEYIKKNYISYFSNVLNAIHFIHTNKHTQTRSNFSDMTFKNESNPKNTDCCMLASLTEN